MASNRLTKRLAVISKATAAPEPTADPPKGEAPVAETAPAEGERPEENLYTAAFRCRQREGMGAGEILEMEAARKELVAKAGHSFLDVRDLTFNPNNWYSRDPESIESLANLIYESGFTTPIVVREMPRSEKYPKGYEVVDGERRCRAHMLLAERYGEHWNMVEAKVFKLNTLSDSDAIFILNAENVGQRAMTPSERARGIAIVWERLKERRGDDPSFLRGRKMREVIGEQFGVSDRTAEIEANIGRNLCEDGMRAYDEGELTKRGADALSRMEPEEQHEVIRQLQAGEITKQQVESISKRKNGTTKVPKKVNDYLREARRSLRKAVEQNEPADRVIIAELKNFIELLDPDGSPTR